MATSNDRLPYLLCFQLMKMLGGPAEVDYFCSFGGQKKPEVRRTLRKLVDAGFMWKRPSRWDGRCNEYKLTSKGRKAVWSGTVKLKAP